MEQNKIKEIPYGVSDFDIVRRDNLYYVDKTMYLPKLEAQARNLFFIRPRRFGKSVFISMLHAYYDILNKDKFNRYCKVRLDSFVDVYRQYYSEEFVKKVFDAEDAVDKLILIIIMTWHTTASGERA